MESFFRFLWLSKTLRKGAVPSLISLFPVRHFQHHQNDQHLGLLVETEDRSAVANAETIGQSTNSLELFGFF